MIDRRSFLKGTLALPAAAALPSFFARAVRAGEPDNRVLVLIQLEGGNDGLNTVIPFGDDLYYKSRPGLGVKRGQVLGLDDHEGFHPSLAGMREIWEAGDLGIIQGVGYVNSSRSHFTSTDIWHTASTQPQERWSGWLGRALDRTAGDEVPALHLDPGPLSLALVGEKIVVPSVSDADRFRVRGQKALMNKLATGRRDDATADYIRQSAQQAYRTSDRIETALARGGGRDAYPGSDLGRRLWQVARMIEAGLPARVYAVRLSGFDTHSQQLNAHAALLKTLGDAMAAFHRDLKKHDLNERVLAVSYSEFGRRVKENRSLGTDHGAAAPMFVAGGAIEGGFHGKHPSLSDLTDGDLKHHTDFRQVYATILDRWLKTDSAAVLGKTYAPVAFL